MDIILTKDERIARLEKELRDLEKRMNRNLALMNNSFETFKSVVQNLQKENMKLKNEMRLLSKYKQAAKEIAKPIVEPVANALLDTSDVIRDFMLEDTGIKTKSADDLLAFIARKRKTTAEAAARELAVSEGRVKYWASRLARDGSIDVKQVLGRMELAKK